MSGATVADGDFVIGGRTFGSRLIVGTGKYRSSAEIIAAIRASGAEMVTVAVRRVNLDRGAEKCILHHLDPAEFFLLPNTAGCYTVAPVSQLVSLLQLSPSGSSYSDRQTSYPALRAVGAREFVRQLPLGTAARNQSHLGPSQASPPSHSSNSPVSGAQRPSLSFQ